MARKWKYEENKLIRDMAEVMAKNEGPFTKKMLIALLEETYPDKYYQQLKNEIAAAFLIDKKCNQRFKVVRPQVWDLTTRPDKDKKEVD